MLRAYAVGLYYLGLRFTAALPSMHLRNLILRGLYGLNLHPDAVLMGRFELRRPRRIQIGKGTVVGDRCELDGREGLSIGQNVNVSSEVKIYTLQHDYRLPGFPNIGGPVIVEDYAWLSTRCTILPGVTVGRGAVVAAGAVVTKDVAPLTVVGGIPATVIAQRPPEALDYCPADYRIPML
jgi:maltose O-acetyltransferase